MDKKIKHEEGEESPLKEREREDVKIPQDQIVKVDC